MIQGNDAMSISWRQRIDDTGRWAAIAIGFAIPVSVSLDNLLLLVVLGCWLAGTNWPQKRDVLKNHPLSRWSLLLFGLLLLGIFWNAQPASEAARTLLKYLDLAFIPLFLYCFRDPESRRRGLLAFAGALTLILVFSLLIRLGIVPAYGPILGSPASPVVFKYRITHSFLMAFGAFLFAWLAISSTPGSRARWGWGLLAMAAMVNVILMVEGMTGVLILSLLGMLLAVTLLPRKALIAALIAVPLLGAGLLSLPGPLAQRSDALLQELRAWQPDVGARDSSAGLRIEFYRNTAGLVAEHPLAGVGTGGFPAAYERKVQGSDMLPTRNPHNEYLLLAAQLGIGGALLLLALFHVQWRLGARLNSSMETGLARGLVIAMAIGCLFNSFLLDHAEGLFFAWMSGLLFAGYRSDTPTGQSA